MAVLASNYPTTLTIRQRIAIDETDAVPTSNSIGVDEHLIDYDSAIPDANCVIIRANCGAALFADATNLGFVWTPYSTTQFKLWIANGLAHTFDLEFLVEAYQPNQVRNALHGFETDNLTTSDAAYESTLLTTLTDLDKCISHRNNIGYSPTWGSSGGRRELKCSEFGIKDVDTWEYASILNGSSVSGVRTHYSILEFY